jgi:hypothetical protein
MDKKSLDPESLIHLKLVTVTHESSSYHFFHSFFKEKKNEFSISAKAKNLFLSLAESIPQTLLKCHFMLCLCVGGGNMGDHWAWEKDDKWPYM